eukprot:GHVN01067456.1.p3 GENE.GHVN01067456.1~~GHVN01067456.1.p3  ORF type:complete len:225 (-),score=35.25 GHVN01067456.1:2198-2872(-)
MSLISASERGGEEDDDGHSMERVNETRLRDASWMVRPAGIPSSGDRLSTPFHYSRKNESTMMPQLLTSCTWGEDESVFGEPTFIKEQRSSQMEEVLKQHVQETQPLQPQPSYQRHWQAEGCSVAELVSGRALPAQEENACHAKRFPNAANSNEVRESLRWSGANATEDAAIARRLINFKTLPLSANPQRHGVNVLNYDAPPLRRRVYPVKVSKAEAYPMVSSHC